MSKTSTAIFDTHANASGALESLGLQGFDPSNISLVASDDFNADSFGVETHSKIAEGTAIGAGVGGATVAVIAGLTSVGAVATGGLGLVAAGPLVSALAGAGAGAAGGSVLGGLIGLAIPEHEIKHYENAVDKGDVLIGVTCNDSDECERAKSIFEQYNASKVSHA
jgi:hypothetical protein